MKQKCRSGSKIYRGFETPESMKIFKIKSGQECTLRGVFNDMATIFIFDTGKFVNIKFNSVVKYL